VIKGREFTSLADPLARGGKLVLGDRLRNAPASGNVRIPARNSRLRTVSRLTLATPRSTARHQRELPPLQFIANR